MGNSFNKIESKIDTEINSVESLGWKDTDVPFDTVESLGWKDTIEHENKPNVITSLIDTIESLGWRDTEDKNDTVESLGWRETEEGNDSATSPMGDDDVAESATSSPFISTELYKKIMDGGKQNGGSLSLSSSKDFDDSSSSSSSSSSTSTSSLEEMLSLSDYSKNKKKSNKVDSQTGSSIEAYGFSNTSSSLSQKFVINSDTSVSKSAFVADSSSINTSDINLVSIDKSDVNVVSANSVNGRRYLN